MSVGFARPVLTGGVGMDHGAVPVIVPEVRGRRDVDAGKWVENVPPGFGRRVLVLMVAG